MKRTLITLLVCCFAVCGTQAQTANELLGKWKLVKWTKKGKEKNIISEFKTDSVYQVFKDKSEFISVVGSTERKSKWKLSADNSTLTIRSGIITVPFSIDEFTPKKRVITSKELGTLTYEKVD